MIVFNKIGCIKAHLSLFLFWERSWCDDQWHFFLLASVMEKLSVNFVKDSTALSWHVSSSVWFAPLKAFVDLVSWVREWPSHSVANAVFQFFFSYCRRLQCLWGSSFLENFTGNHSVILNDPKMLRYVVFPLLIRNHRYVESSLTVYITCKYQLLLLCKIHFGFISFFSLITEVVLVVFYFDKLTGSF